MVSSSRANRRRVIRRRRLLFDQLERRHLLATIIFEPLADGVVGDRDVNGTFESVETSDLTLSNRNFSFANPGREFPVLEFDSNSISISDVVTSATLELTISSFTGAPGQPTFAVKAISNGDARVRPDDALFAGINVGGGAVSSLSVLSIPLDASWINTHRGALALRIDNLLSDDAWFSFNSSESGAASRPRLVLDTTTFTISSVTLSPTSVSEAAGTDAATGTIQFAGISSSPLRFSGTSSDLSEASLPPIGPSGQGIASTSFTINAVDDTDFDGSQTVSIGVSATVDIAKRDLTFGGTTTGAVALPSSATENIIAVQADGKIIVAGAHTDSSWRLIRYLPTGSIDSTFGSGGVVTTFLATAQFPSVRSIALQADGKILVGGRLISGTSRGALARYNSNGTLDTTFGVNGTLINDVGPERWINDIDVRSDGKILLTLGLNGTARFELMQLNSNGTRDVAYGATATATFPVQNVASQSFVLSDGSAVTVGGSHVIKTTSTGSLDTAFGNAGVVTLSYPDAQSLSMSLIELDSTGRIVLGGSRSKAIISGTLINDFAAFRLLSNGSLDPSFGNGGRVATAVGAYINFANDLHVGTDGSITLGGANWISDFNRESALVRYLPNGQLDQRFFDDGIFIQKLTPSGDPSIQSIAGLQDGSLVTVSGTSGTILSRFDSTSINVASGNAMLIVTDNEPDLQRTVIGTVYSDANRNQLRDAIESGVPGLRIYSDTNNNSTWNAGEPSVFKFER